MANESNPKLSATYSAIGSVAKRQYNINIERGFGLRVQILVDDESHAQAICDAVNNSKDAGNDQT